MTLPDGRTKRLTKGQFVLCTAGEYSDFGVLALYEVLEDMDVPYRETRFKGQPLVFDYQRFIASPSVREVPHIELWQGDG